MGKTPKEIREASSGVAADDNVIHASTSTSDNESIGILAEDISKLSSLQTAYDKGEEILTADATPVKIKAPTDVFQTILEIKDQQNNLPITVDGSGEIEQKPFNLELKNTINSGDNGILLTSPGTFEAHSRFVFIANKGASAGIEIISITNPEDPEHINLITDAGSGNPPFVKTPLDVKHHGSHLYIISNQSPDPVTFSIIDISNPNLPISLGHIEDGTDGAQLAQARQIYVRGDFVYVSDFGSVAGEGWINIFDVSDPTNIKVANVIADGDDSGDITINRPTAFTIHENLLYVANTNGAMPNQPSGDVPNVELIDITDPINPKHVSNVESAGPPYLATVNTIQATRDVVYFFSISGLQIMDYADITAPVSKSFLIDGVNETFGTVRSGLVEGKFVYMDYRTIPSDIFIASIDVMDSTAPVVLKKTLVATSVLNTEGLTLLGNHIYLLNGDFSGKIYILRTSGLDTQAIRAGAARIGNLDVKDEMSARIFDVSEDAFVGGGLLVNGRITGQKSATIKSVDDDSVKIISPQFQTDGITAASVFQPVLEIRDQEDNLPLKIEGSGEIEQVPFNLKLASTVNGTATSLVSSTGMKVHSRFLFVDNSVGGPNNGIEIYSISDPENPELLTNISEFFTSAGNFQHHGDILYVADVVASVTTLRLIDIGNPTDPKELGSFTSGTDGSSFSAGEFTVQGSTAYLTDSTFGVNKVTILDVSDPENIQVIKVISNGEITALTNLAGTLSGYTDGEAITLSGGTGSGATATAVISGGTIQSVTLVDGGSGYTDSDTLTITGVSSTTATATIDVDAVIVLAQPRIAVVHENFLFVYNLSTIVSVECIDISDPKKPLHLSNIVDGLGSAPFLESVTRFHVTRDVAHFCNITSKSIQAIDYADPENPVVKDSVKDGDPGVSIDSVSDCVVAGKYAYMLNQDTITDDIKIATIDLQDADNLVFLQNKTIVNDTETVGTMAITGDHLYFTNRANQPNGKLYSIRNSGLETQSMRVGAGRFGDVDVKDTTTCRLADISESLHVGGRGILSNGKISGQKSSDIVRKEVSLVAPTAVELDFADDLTVYNIDLTGVGAGDIEASVTNLKAGHRILLKHKPSAAGDVVTFSGAIYFLTSSLASGLDTVNANYVELEVLDNSGGFDTILVKIYDF